jgi:SAM-dependent methyltransferase
MPFMPKVSDPEYLRAQQYRDATNLNARIALHVRFSTNAYGWMPWVFDQLTLAPDSRVLELGCGPGRLWQLNLTRMPAGWDVTLSDFSPGMVRQARHNLDAQAGRFHFAVVDAQALPFAGERFDAVIANHMLYHVPDRARALGEMRRVLRPGGRLYASTVGRAHLREIRELLRRFDPAVLSWGEPALGPFLLENGGDEIARDFVRLAVHRYADALAVTEAEPLVAFVASTDAEGTLTGERLAQFTDFVQQELAEQGAIHITKDSGLFEAVRE